jgi:hypothetical protein
MVRKGKERAGFLTKKGNVSVGKIYHMETATIE